MKKTIDKSTLDFLKKLNSNNNREWFNTNKDKYLSGQENMAAFIDELIVEMKKHDEIDNISGKKSLFRIYKDVRFSKDKTPYSPRFAFSFKRSTKYLRGGYYVNIKPGNYFMACGFFGPNSEDLKRIRMDINYNYPEWNKILKLKSIKSNFGEMIGETVATTPRGFEKDHPAIDLLRHKQFLFRHDFTEKEVLSPNFGNEINKRFKAIRPYFDYMSEVLTTDANGELIV